VAILPCNTVATKRQLQNGVKNMPFFVAKNLALRCAKMSDCTCRLRRKNISAVGLGVFCERLCNAKFFLTFLVRLFLSAGIGKRCKRNKTPFGKNECLKGVSAYETTV